MPAPTQHPSAWPASASRTRHMSLHSLSRGHGVEDILLMAGVEEGSTYTDEKAKVVAMPLGGQN